MLVASVIVTATWVFVALTAALVGRPALARTAGLVALAQGIATFLPQAAPLAVAAWLTCGLSLPDGALGTPVRRLIAATGGAAALAWTLAWPVTSGPVIGATVGGAAIALVGVAVRCPRAPAGRRRTLQWIAAATVATVAADAVLLAVHVLLDTPARLLPWTLVTMAIMPVGLFFSQIPVTARLSERALVEMVVVAGLAMLVVAVYLVVVVGLARSPVGAERDVLFASVSASLTAVVLAIPVRFRLVAFGKSLLGRRGQTPEEALASFGARMSRAVPFDELLLQLVESLHAALGPAGAEVWVGTDGVLHRTVSVPERADGQANGQITLNHKECLVVGRTRIGGSSWLSVWLPALLNGHPPEAPIRVAPAAHLGDLLGLLVVRRPREGVAFSDEDDRVLVELARQVGLALHNMRLDSALQDSLDELRKRNAELQASRLRIVTAADAARRAIERDLHDGAQQHIVALSIKIGLAQQLLEEDVAGLADLLEELRTDVQTTGTAVRDLAHGIYPPLLRNHGLGHALNSVARRSTLPCGVTVDLPERYPEQIEAAVYFCCLEAIQNAAKYAGPEASIEVRVGVTAGVLEFRVGDDGPGFEIGSNGLGGAGFVNMTDRLGAIGGTLHVDSRPGAGTVVRGEIPVARP